MAAVQTLARKRAKVNREAWLTEAIRQVRPLFKRAGYDVPPVRVSVGFPAGKRVSSAGTVIGQCFSPGAAKDGKAQIFVSPVVSDGRKAVEVLVHELCHAVDGNVNGHGAAFAAIAYGVGFEGKPTHTHLGFDLAAFAEGLVKRLGKYPHAELTDVVGGTKKQTTRMVKMTCSCEPARIIRCSKAVAEGGDIRCEVCGDYFAAEAVEDEGEGG